MDSEDKSVLISGLMFLALSTALTITGLFFMQALGVGVIAAVVTYVFFDTCYYVKKDWLLLPIANSRGVLNIYVLKIYN